MCTYHVWPTETAGGQDQVSSTSAVVNPVGTLPSTQTAAPADPTQQQPSFRPTHPLPTEGTERDGVRFPKDSQQGGGKDEDEGQPEESFTAMDDMLLLDNGGAYQSDEEESQEVSANPTSLTATNPNLTKVLPDRFVQADNPSVHSPPPYTPQAAGSMSTSFHPLPSAPMQPTLMSPTITSPQGSYRPHLPPAPVQQTGHHLPPSYAQVRAYVFVHVLSVRVGFIGYWELVMVSHDWWSKMLVFITYKSILNASLKEILK